MPSLNNHADVYTDGSCHTQLKVGAWVAILFINKKKIVLTGKENATTHNRMELTAVMKAVEYIKELHKAVTVINIITDSQYAVGLTGRKEKLSALGFTTKRGTAIQNADLVKALLNLTESVTITFKKIKAHQKESDEPNYNIEADKLSREIMREEITRVATIVRRKVSGKLVEAINTSTGSV